MYSKNKKKITTDLVEIIKNSPNLNFLKNKKILISGGAGMLLSYFVVLISYLNTNKNLKIKLYLLSTNIKKHKKKLVSLGSIKNIYFIKVDQNHTINKKLKIDYIIHGAGYGDPKIYQKKFLQVIDNGVMSTINLLNLAKKSKIKKLVYISSGAVYGHADTNKTVNEDFISIKNHKDNHDFYGSVKNISEQLCRMYQKKKYCSVNILRPTHTYGPTYNNVSQDSRFMAQILHSIIQKKPFLIKGNLKSKRSFTHIIDFTTALLFVLKSAKSGEDFNIGNDKCFKTVKEVVNVCQKLNIKFQYSLKNKNSKEISKMFMISKKVQKLGWRPKIDLENGILRTLDIYK